MKACNYVKHPSHRTIAQWNDSMHETLCGSIVSSVLLSFFFNISLFVVAIAWQIHFTYRWLDSALHCLFISKMCRTIFCFRCQKNFGYYLPSSFHFTAMFFSFGLPRKLKWNVSFRFVCMVKLEWLLNEAYFCNAHHFFVLFLSLSFSTLFAIKSQKKVYDDCIHIFFFGCNFLS